MNCIGCAIASKERTPPGGIIKETPNFVLHQDPEVPIKHFLIIASKRHVRSITDFTPDQNAELFKLCWQARKALLLFHDVIDCKLIQEERSGHFHLWILPRYAWMDEVSDNTLEDVRALMRYAKETRNTGRHLDEIVAAAGQLRALLSTDA